MKDADKLLYIDRIERGEAEPRVPLRFQNDPLAHSTSEIPYRQEADARRLRVDYGRFAPPEPSPMLSLLSVDLIGLILDYAIDRDQCPVTITDQEHRRWAFDLRRTCTAFNAALIGKGYRPPHRVIFGAAGPVNGQDRIAFLTRLMSYPGAPYRP